MLFCKSYVCKELLLIFFFFFKLKIKSAGQPHLRLHDLRRHPGSHDPGNAWGPVTPGTSHLGCATPQARWPTIAPRCKSGKMNSKREDEQWTWTCILKMLKAQTCFGLLARFGFSVFPMLAFGQWGVKNICQTPYIFLKGFWGLKAPWENWTKWGLSLSVIFVQLTG